MNLDYWVNKSYSRQTIYSGTASMNYLPSAPTKEFGTTGEYEFDDDLGMYVGAKIGSKKVLPSVSMIVGYFLIVWLASNLSDIE